MLYKTNELKEDLELAVATALARRMPFRVTELMDQCLRWRRPACFLPKYPNIQHGNKRFEDFKEEWNPTRNWEQLKDFLICPIEPVRYKIEGKDSYLAWTSKWDGAQLVPTGHTEFGSSIPIAVCKAFIRYKLGPEFEMDLELPKYTPPTDPGGLSWI